MLVKIILRYLINCYVTMKILLISILILLSLTACNGNHKNKKDNLVSLNSNKPIESSLDSLDYVLSKEGFDDAFGSKKTYHQITKQEQEKAKLILTEYVNRGGGDTIYFMKVDKRGKETGEEEIEIRKPLPLKRYFKQYIAYKENGHIMVLINLEAQECLFNRKSIRESLKNRVHYIFDGGIMYGNAIIDLNLGKVVAFHLNGEA
jgi:hypothetical protein